MLWLSSRIFQTVVRLLMRVKEFFIILLITFLLLFIGAEVYLRCFVFLARPIFTEKRTRMATCRPDPHLGWVNSTGVYTSLPLPSGSMPFTVTIGNDGSRATAACDTHFDNSRDKIILVGDSWMFGQALSDSQTMGWKLQQLLPEMNVLNYGVKGYGAYQSLLMLERVLPETHNTTFVIYGFLGHHIVRNIAPPHWRAFLNVGQKVSVPYVTLKEDQTIIRHKPEGFSPWPVGNYLATFRLLEMFLKHMSFLNSDNHTESFIIMQHLLIEMRKFCGNHDSKLIVAMFNMPREMVDFYTRFCFTNHIPVINFDYSAIKDKSLVIAGDGHPNEAVNALWAEQVAVVLMGLRADQKVLRF